jgi:hypothetical protein
MSGRRFAYSFKGRVGETGERELSGTEMQTLLAIKDTLTTITAACEVCHFNDESHCMKHKHEIKPGDPRCQDFARRLPRELGEDPSQAQYQAYVNHLLGVKPATLQRLTGQR